MKRNLAPPTVFYKSLAGLIVGLCLSFHGLATAYVSNTAAGLWTATTSWLPAGVPGAGDDVTILAGQTITMNANPGACNNLTIYGTLTWVNARTLAAGGNLVLNSGGVISGTATGVLSVAGTFTAAAGTETIGQNAMTITSNAIINGVITFNSATGAQIFTGPITMNDGSGIRWAATRPVTFNGAVSTNGTVTLSGTTTGTLNLGSTLNVASGSIFNIGSTFLSIAGATTDDGDVVFTDPNGTKSFNSITVDPGGIWDCSAVDFNFVITGNLTNNGTFNPGATLTGTEYKFTSATATIAGTVTIPHLSISAAGIVTNTGVLTISDSLYGSGKYFQDAGSTLLYNTAKRITVNTFNPSAAGNLVDYVYAGAQTVYGGNSVNYYNLNISNTGTKTLGNTLNVLGNLTVQGTATLDVDATSNYAINAGGNWAITSTSATPFVQEQGTVTFNGSSGVQAISTVVAGGQAFYNVVFNNTSASNPNITTAVNISVSHNTTFTQGYLDLQGNSYVITGDVTNTTDRLNGGGILTSVAGSTFKVTDPNKNKIIYYSGTQIGTAANGITISDTSGRIQFTNFTEYGTATFVKTLNTDDVFGGGNFYHGPVTFVATLSASRWRMGDNNAAPDTFYNATFYANSNSGSNNNFIVCANSVGNAFYGTTTMTSVTVGGFFVCRNNGTGQSSARFYGPVVATIGFSGNMTFADAAPGFVNSVTFDSSITLNSTATSSGFFHFADNNKYGTVLLNTGAQFLSGSISGQTNIYLCNLTQLGPRTQTINTSGSTGALYVGGVTSLPAYSCTFNGTCNFTADTAGYFIGSRFNGPTSIIVNHTNANGYIIGDTSNSSFSAIVGNIRFQNNIFNGTTFLDHTSSFTSSSNGGNTFNGLTEINNSGTGILRQGGYSGLGDVFNGDVTFVQSGPGAILSPAYNSTSTFAGNISVTGSSGTPITFASGSVGNVTINGSGTQTFSIGGAPTPTIVNLTIATAAATNILQFNYSPSITGTLNLTQGLINLNAYTLTLGTSAAAAGTLNYVSGWVYGGTFTRWFAKTSLAIPGTVGLFPVGTDPIQNAYQPVWFGYSSNLTTGGTLSVYHNPTITGYTPVLYFDASWGNTVKAVSIAAWQISAGNGLTPNGSTAQLRLGANGYGTFSLPDLNASLASSAVGTFVSATNTNVALEVNRTGLSLANLNNTWYIGTKDLTTSPLPVQLLRFNARLAASGIVDLTWATAMEVNNKSFTVERSQDGASFVPVVEVAGAGNSSLEQDYSAVDQHPYSGISYYRLRQTDLDGVSTFSRVAVIDAATPSVLRLYPVPARSNLQLTLTAATGAQVVTRIVDAGGKVLATSSAVVQAGVNTLNFNVSGYRSGAYFLQLVAGDGSSQTIPFSVF
jgi:type IX secretion system substrate protein/G8 domain-containing protein